MFGTAQDDQEPMQSLRNLAFATVLVLSFSAALWQAQRKLHKRHPLAIPLPPCSSGISNCINHAEGQKSKVRPTAGSNLAFPGPGRN